MVKQTGGFIAFLIIFWLLPLQMPAQDSNMPKPCITVFIPLMLDTTVVNGKAVYTKTMPVALMNSLDFYNGMQIAATELEEQGIAATIRVIDLKSAKAVDEYFQDSLTVGKGIVIAVAQTSADLNGIADRLKPTGVPLITILPNDAGVTGYPQMMVSNSTLKVHCEQLHRFLQKNHSIDNMVFLNINGNAESRLIQYLEDANKTSRSVKLNWKKLGFGEHSEAESIIKALDSNQLNVIVAPTLNITTAQKIVKLLSELAPTYRTAVFGMPTWEIVNFSKSDFKNVDVWYGTPFLSSNGNTLQNEEFSKKYRALTNSKPGDMAYRGYELTFRYVRTLSQYGPAFLQHINDYRFKVFNDFEFVPVSLRNNGKTDYLENQKIYFIKKTDGAVKTVMAP